MFSHFELLHWNIILLPRTQNTYSWFSHKIFCYDFHSNYFHTILIQIFTIKKVKIMTIILSEIKSEFYCHPAHTNHQYPILIIYFKVLDVLAVPNAFSNTVIIINMILSSGDNPKLQRGNWDFFFMIFLYDCTRIILNVFKILFYNFYSKNYHPNHFLISLTRIFSHLDFT